MVATMTAEVREESKELRIRMAELTLMMQYHKKNTEELAGQMERMNHKEWNK